MKQGLRFLTIGSALALAALAATSLVGCSSQSDASDTSSTDGTTAITVIRSPGGAFESVLAAQNEGMFSDAGLDVTIDVGTGASATNVAQLVSGEAQFAMLDAGTLINSVASGVDLVMVQQAQTAGSDNGLLVPPGSTIADAADLEGATVGVTAIGSMEYTLQNYWLEQQGVDTSTIDFVQLTPDALESAATEGQVDAIISFGSFYTMTKDDGFTALNGGSGEIMPNVPQGIWVATGDYVKDHEEVVRAFADAMTQAGEWANDNADAIRDIDRENTELPESYIASYELDPYTDVVHADMLEKLAQAAKDQGTIDTVPTADDLLWSGVPRA